MAVHTTIKNDIFTVIFEDDFSCAAVFDAWQKGMDDAAFQAPMRALMDARQASTEPTAMTAADEGRLFAEIRHCFIPHWAIVASSDRCLFEIARMICTCSDFQGVDMRAYSDIEEARSRLIWSNFSQQDPFCRIPISSCRPNFIRS